jgi:inorganic pyrophosphatase
MEFWTNLDQLISTHKIIIDRPKGSVHPRYPDMVYCLDYGYLQGTTNPDGNEIDVWRGTLGRERLVGVVCTWDSTKLDTEVKLLIGCSGQEIHEIRTFYRRSKYMSAIVLRRNS